VKMVMKLRVHKTSHARLSPVELLTYLEVSGGVPHSLRVISGVIDL
jgi:hypothetical protein